ncbi:alpha/beta hydrolase [Gordonia insulae]|uniref:Poly(3-hydroxyalkanoate) polymerase subunit PhaC n=1 Tax=Gordonia insulae TaxID=2420509 RepID=A0A3G8JN71_9ACTN|nr:alpha/beta hydrolase [Gordonia insulae]AZG46521.1 Poly(3-hydroxyalkanoate) polymerase subunit PhaC [Gordonia insulae]
MFDGVRTLYRLTRGERVAEDRPTPSTVIADGPHRHLRRCGTDDDLTKARSSGRTPVLLVPPLAVPARCYDLSPDMSVVAFLLSTGRIPYVVDFGEMGYADRHLGFEAFFDDIVPEAIGHVIADFDGGTGQVDIAAWSLGGTVAFLTVGAHPDLPVRSITGIGTPLNYSLVQPYPIVKRIVRPIGPAPVKYTLKAMGGIPGPLVRFAYRATAWERELKKPGYIMRNADNTEALARMQVIDWFQDALPGYPGRLAEQMWENLVYRDELAGGVLDFDGRRVDLTSIGVPIQLFGSHRDAIVSWAAARHGVEIFADSAEVHFSTVETSHLGLIAGSDASGQTWPRIDAFLSSLDRVDA